MKYLMLLVFALGTYQLQAQKYICNEGEISFFSEAPLENIKANSNKASSLIDLEKGEVAFSVPINSFQFKKALMQKHFNENYMESDQFPKATFTGKIEQYENQEGQYRALAVGDLTIHGQKRKVSIEGDLSIKDQQVTINAVFPVKLKDHKIKIPKILFSNIAEEVEVTLNFQYQPYASQ